MPPSPSTLSIWKRPTSTAVECCLPGRRQGGGGATDQSFESVTHASYDSSRRSTSSEARVIAARGVEERRAPPPAGRGVMEDLLDPLPTIRRSHERSLGYRIPRA
jgi:hypothetical protein